MGMKDKELGWTQVWDMGWAKDSETHSHSQYNEPPLSNKELSWKL
jgi:hypothetical protein